MLQVKEELTPWISKLWETRPQRYSRAVLEILALIAYKQPITRAEIEEVRGVAVSSDIVKRLFDREWIKIVGHKEVPGRPALFSTTDEFLNYFGLSSLSELPTLPNFVGEDGQELGLPTLKQHEIGVGSEKISEAADEYSNANETGNVNAEETQVEETFQSEDDSETGVAIEKIILLEESESE